MKTVDFRQYTISRENDIMGSIDEWNGEMMKCLIKNFM